MDSDQFEVIIVDDHLSVRKGLELLLSREELRVAGVAGESKRRAACSSAAAATWR